MNAPPLVVLTRPAGRADQALAACHRAGWKALHIPLLCLARNQDFTEDINALAQQADAILFVSPSAVDFAARGIDWTSFRGTVLAVGAASAAALRAVAGRGVLYPPDGNDSEALLRLPLWREKRGHLLIVRGVGGRALLAQTLRADGWTVTCAEVYRSRAQVIDSATRAAIAAYPGEVAVILTSVRSAQAWLASMGAQYGTMGERLLYFTIHARISAVLRDAGMRNVADYHSESDIIAALQQRWEQT